MASTYNDLIYTRIYKSVEKGGGRRAQVLPPNDECLRSTVWVPAQHLGQHLFAVSGKGRDGYVCVSAAELDSLKTLLFLVLVAVGGLPGGMQLNATGRGCMASFVAVVEAKGGGGPGKMAMEVQPGGTRLPTGVVQLVTVGAVLARIVGHLTKVLDHCAVFKYHSTFATEIR